MTELFKFAHIAAIALWSGGLICMPFLFVQRAGVVQTGNDHELHRMHAMVRFFYVVILSPSAFVAVATGTALVYLQQTFDSWFTAKLVFVGMLVMLHVLSGLVILRLFQDAGHYPLWRYVAMTAVTTTIVTIILVIVTAKPQYDIASWGGDLFAPGALGDWLEPIIYGVLQ